MRKRRYATSVIAFNLALLPWSVGSVVWAARATPAEISELRVLLVAPLKIFGPMPGIRFEARAASAPLRRLLHELRRASPP